MRRSFMDTSGLTHLVDFQEIPRLLEHAAGSGCFRAAHFLHIHMPLRDFELQTSDPRLESATQDFERSVKH